MAKRKFIVFTYIIFFVLTNINCNKKHEDQCLSYSTATVTRVAGPNSITANQEIDLTVSWYLINGCGHFQNVTSNSAGNITTISINAKYEGCICTDMLMNGELTYKFKAAQPGTYYLKFLQPNKNYFVDTIKVN